jgi:hypothetical protein
VACPVSDRCLYSLNSFLLNDGQSSCRFRSKKTIVGALHDSPMGGHSGFPDTYRQIKQLFAWKGMKTLIKTYVAQCDVCQQSKPDKSHYPCLLQSLLVPEQSWQVINMDFVEGLPRSHNADTILVVMDTFQNTHIFYPCYIHILLSKWLSCLWTQSISCTGCPALSFQTGIISLQVTFGRSCFDCQTLLIK